MKKFVQIVAMLLVSAAVVNGAQGWLNSYVYVWRGAGGDVYYDLNGNDQVQNFDGAVLGTYDPNSLGMWSSLFLNSQLNAWVDNNDYYKNDAFQLFYRVYEDGGGTPSWQSSVSTEVQSQGGNNWRALTPGVNIVEGLESGSYRVDVFAYKIATNDLSQASWEERIWDEGIDNQPFSATFNVIPEPVTLGLVGVGLGLVALLRRRR